MEGREERIVSSFRASPHARSPTRRLAGSFDCEAGARKFSLRTLARCINLWGLTSPRLTVAHITQRLYLERVCLRYARLDHHVVLDPGHSSTAIRPVAYSPTVAVSLLTQAAARATLGLLGPCAQFQQRTRPRIPTCYRLCRSCRSAIISLSGSSSFSV